MSNVQVSSTDGIVNGTSGNDTFVSADGSASINGGSTLVGGLGDDNYYVAGMNIKVVEQANGGNDTITSASSYALPANVENLWVWGDSAAFGNDLDNVIVGSSANNLIDGGKGNDILYGGGGSDIYQVDANSGDDLVVNWTGGSAIRLAGYSQFHTLADVTAAMTQNGNDVFLKLDATDGITIQNTTIGAFTAANFQFTLNTSQLGAMTFDDEFNSLSTRVRGGSTGTWDTEYGYGATSNSYEGRTLGGNNEKELYVDPTFTGKGTTSLGLNPFSIDNGVLTISEAPTPAADKAAAYNFDYTSGVLTTRESFAQTYGYFEAKMELPTGQGAWPAFWLVRQDGTWPPELDVMEDWGNNTAVGTVHTEQTGTHTSQSNPVFVPTADSQMHTYGILWTPTTLTWYIDGVATYTTATPADMHSPMYMILNLAVAPTVTDPNLTTQMKVDYVHAYSLADSPVSTGVTTAPVTTTPVTTTPVVTAPVTIAPVTVTPAVTTAPVTVTPAVTPAPVATTAVTDHGYWGANPALSDGFNAEYYVEHNPDVAASGMNPHTHYLEYGKAEGRLPYDPDAATTGAVSSTSHAYWGEVSGAEDGFNAAYYAAHNPDVVASGMDLLTHYEEYGKSEGRLAYDPTETTAAGSATAPVATTPVTTTPVTTTPVTTTVTDHGYWGANPALSDGFNVEYYLEHNPDVAASGMNPHTHYLEYGKAEGRLPYDPDAATTGAVSSTSHAYWGEVSGAEDGFNAAYYAAHNPDVVASGMDLLTHYEEYGKSEGRLAYDPTETTAAGSATASVTTTPMTTTPMTTTPVVTTPVTTTPVTTTVADHAYWGANPNMPDGFNLAYYAAHNPDLVAAGVNLLTEYEQSGKAAGRLGYDPDATTAVSVSATSHGYWGAVASADDGFNAAYYAAHNPDVVASGMDLLTHYEEFGKAEGRLGFDPTVSIATAPASGHAYWGAVAGVEDDFNAAYYAAHNPDVVAAGMNLLTHYEEFGKSEGRLAYDPNATSDVDTSTPAYTPVAAASGNTTLVATAGHDTFYLSPGIGTDTIVGFDTANDKLDIATLIAKYGTPTFTDMPSDLGTAVHWSGGETIQLLGVSHTDAQHAVLG